MASPRNDKPKLDRRGQPKDTDSFRTLECAHGRYGASETREKSKRAPVGKRANSLANRRATNSVKPIGT